MTGKLTATITTRSTIGVLTMLQSMDWSGAEGKIGGISTSVGMRRHWIAWALWHLCTHTQ